LSSPSSVASFFAAAVVVVAFSSFAFADVVDDVVDVFDRVEEDFGFSSVFFSGVFVTVVVGVVGVIVFPAEDDSALFVGLLDTDFVLDVTSVGAEAGAEATAAAAAGAAVLDEEDDEVSMDWREASRLISPAVLRAPMACF